MGNIISLTDEKCIDISVQLYNKYRNESWILSPNQCLEKSNSWFGNEKFKIPFVKEELKNNRIHFGLESGVFFLSKELYKPEMGSYLVEQIMNQPFNILLVSKRKRGNVLPFIRKESIQSYINSNDFNENKQKDIFSFIDGDKWSVYSHEEECVITLTDQELTFLKELKKNLLNEIEIIENLNKKEEEKKVESLESKKLSLLQEFDKNGNGEIDIIEGNDFNILLKKHQKTITDIDKNYIQKFVKVSSYLKHKKRNIKSIFNSLKETPNQEVLKEYVETLKDECHNYNLVVFNSLNMIVSLVEDEMITFYEIYEVFDTLNIFDSKHEKDISNKLMNIGDGIEDLMYEVRTMGNRISNSIEELSCITEESNRQLTDQLSEIDSTLKVGNLINTINTYQNYKSNRKLK